MTNVLKLTKKIFTVGVVATTIVWSLGVAALVPGVANAATCPTLTAGDMVKVTGKPAIYAVDNNLKVRYFDNGDVFKSWRPTYGGYVSISMDCLDSLGIPSAAPYGVTYRPGSYVVKRASSDQLYVVEPNNTLAKITPEVAKVLYGTGYKVMTITDQDWPNYVNRGADVTEAKAHPGMLVKNGGKTWYVNTNNQLQEVTEEGMVANGFQTKFVRTVADSVVAGLSVGTPITSEVKALTDKTQSGGVVSTPTSGSLTVSLAADTPSGTIVAGQANAHLASFVFNGTGLVKTIKLQRIGVSTDDAFSNVYLYDGNVRISDAATAANGVLTFANSAGFFDLNGSKVISVKADIATNTSGMTLGVALTDVTYGTNSMLSGLNVAGNTMSVASGANLATVAVGSNNVVTQDVNAGTENFVVWSAPFTVGTRSVKLSHIALRMIGSAPTDALSNFRLFVNGVQVASNSTLGANETLNFSLSSPVTLQTGNTTVEVRADVIKGSSRNFYFTVETAADLMLADTSYNVGVAATGYGSTSQSSTVTIKSGTVTVTSDPDFNVTTVNGGANGVSLAKFLFKGYGEDVKVSYLTVSTTKSLDNYAIFADGVQVANSKNIAANNTETYNLGSSLVIPAGKTVVVEVRADLKSGGSNVTSGTVSVVLGATASANGMGNTSKNTTFVPGGSSASTVSGPTLTIGSAALVVAKNSAYSDQAVAPNASKYKIGSYVLQAGPYENVRVTNLQVVIGGTLSTTHLAALYLGNAVNTAEMNPQTTNNFPVDFTINKNQTVTVDVYASIGNSSGTVTTTLAVTATGIDSNVSVSPSSATAGQTITVGAGSLTYPSAVTADSDAAQFVLGATTQSKLAVYNFVASNGAAVIEEMGFTVNSSGNPITSLTVGGVTSPVVNNTATTTGLAINVPIGYAGTDVPVSATYSAVGIGGHASNVTTTVTLTYVKWRSGSTVSSTSALSVASNQMTLVASKPALQVTASSEKLVNGSVKVGRITVQADSKGSVRVDNLPITLTSVGDVTVASTTGAIVVKDQNGIEYTVSTTAMTGDLSAGGSINHIVEFTGGVLISAGQTRTFDIYVTAANVAGTNDALLLKLGAAASFQWDDVVGNGLNLTGTAIFGYPNNSVSISNSL